MSRDESRRSKRARADRDYELGPDSNILMGDYDDERTLDEEEALEGSEDTHNELSNLQKESDMPLQDLLTMYGYNNMENDDPNRADDNDDDEEDDEEEEEEEEEDEDDDPATYESDLKQFYTDIVKEEENGTGVTRPAIAKPGDPIRVSETNAPSINAHTNSTDSKPDDDTIELNSIDNHNSSGNTDMISSENVNNATNLSNSGNIGGGGGPSRLLRSVSRPQSEEEEDDCDYSPDEEEWKKTIMVGSDYQAAIPEGLCKYDDALPYENVDKMLWDPYPITEEEVEEYLSRAQLPVVKSTSLPSGNHVRDDEQAMYLLLQCGYNLEEALRRRRMNALPSTESVSLWSEEECHNFESGLRNYGKDFHLIQKNKVRTRSVGELVQFYYLWKKTERHDIFTCKARLEKKKYALHPGVTDYMDRFLDEQEGVRDRSSSPNVHNSLLYGDAKRQRTNTNQSNSDEPLGGGGGKSTIDNWDGGSATTVTPTATTTANSTGATTTTPSNDSAATPVNNNSGTADTLPADHHHQHRHNSSSPTAVPLDFAKANSNAAVAATTTASVVEANVATAAAWPATTSVTTVSSPASITVSSSASPQQQQQPRMNHFHPHYLQQPSQPAAGANNSQPLVAQAAAAASTTSNNEEQAAATGARSQQNILPHLPP